MKAKLVKENINFNRAEGDVKYSDIGIGVDRHGSYIKKGLIQNSKEKNDFYDEDESEWLLMNPNLANALNYKNKDLEDHKNIVGIDADTYMEELVSELGYEFEDYDIKDEFTSEELIKAIVPGEVNIEIGHLNDGSKVIYYWGGIVDGFIARLEWLK